MKRIITYGTYDLLHYGHVRLLERAKMLGDYLIVGVTSDDFDRTRGKINVQQSLTERIAAVRETGLADLIIVEEYEGQKIDDIQRYDIDLFAIGSDWKGKFDYLEDYCDVVYLDRTEGISSSQIRSQNRGLKLGMVGNSVDYLNKVKAEDNYVNGVTITGICCDDVSFFSEEIKKLPLITNDYKELVKNVDAVYIKSDQKKHYEQIKFALENGKSVLCESPIDINKNRCKSLFELAKNNNCILMEATRTAYSTAYSRLLLLLKSGKIGNIISVDVTCTSMKKNTDLKSLLDWGGNALLPIFQILGVNYNDKRFITRFKDADKKEDIYTKVEFLYDRAIGTINVAEGAKSEGELIVTGTKGYLYVPAPWWKTDYFEIRFENQTENKRYFYQLDGEGIRYELVAFARNVQDHKQNNIYISEEVSLAISQVMEDFESKVNVIEI